MIKRAIVRVRTWAEREPDIFIARRKADGQRRTFLPRGADRRHHERRDHERRLHEHRLQEHREAAATGLGDEALNPPV